MPRPLASLTALLALTLLLTGCAGRLDPRFLACVISGGEPEACFDVLNPPTPPENVQARGSETEQAIVLSWSGSRNADRFVVARGDQPGGPYAEIAETSPVFPGYRDTAVERGRVYYYVVDAVNENGRARSAEVSACACVEPPGRVANVRASSSLRGILVEWDALAGASTYEVARGDRPGGPYTPLTDTSGVAVDDQSVEPFRAYFYVVTATNGVGRGPASDEAAGEWRPERPARPTGLRASSTDRGIRLDWDAVPGAESYVAGRSETAGGPYTDLPGRTIPNLDDESVELGRTYFYVVRAVNPAGSSDRSDEVAGVWDPVRPAAPTDVRAVSFAGGIRVTWAGVPAGLRSVVARGTAPGGPYADVAQVLGAAFEDTTVALRTPYYYVVYAETLAGVRSAASAEAVGFWCGQICGFADFVATTRPPARPAVRFSASFATASFAPGDVRLDGGRLLGAGSRAAGTFELTVEEGAQTRRLAGTWTSTADFALDLSARTGSESVVLADGGGDACMRLRNVHEGLPGDAGARVRTALTLATADGLLLSGTAAGAGGTVEGTGRSARFARLPVSCDGGTLLLDARGELQELRDRLAATAAALTQRERTRLRKALADLDRALDPPLWAGDGTLLPAGGAALLSLRSAFGHLPAEGELAELARLLAEARLAGVELAGEADAAALAAARDRLDAAGEHPGTKLALASAVKAWAALAGQPPR